MKSQFSLFGHPLHPMLVVVPVGLFLWTFVADLVFVAVDRQHWYDIAFWTGIAAVITGLVAALPGFGDFFTIALKSDARDIAITHMALNLAVVALFFVAALMMMDNGATSGGMLTAVVIMHGVGVGMLLLSGWLGGEMAYRHHLAMIPDTPELETEEHRQHEMRPEYRSR